MLGNQRLKENLIQSISRGRVSHFYLICGPVGSGKHTLARLMAAAMVCKEQQKPCLQCAACRKVMAGSHPDFITVDDPDKKTVTVDLVRQARADMFIQPNEADRKIYLFPRAQDMRVEGQNALLKVLEEPPSYGVFLLLTDNPEKLLPTVRSRCTELKLQGLTDAQLRHALQHDYPSADAEQIDGAIARCGGYLGQAKTLLEDGITTAPQTEKFADAYANKNKLLILQTLASMERLPRDQALELFNQWAELLQNALACRSGMQASSAMAKQLAASRSSADLMQGIQLMKKCIEYAQGNVSVAAICGYLLWHLR